ncbi:hypothetical protein TNCV_2964321 [Trichonephila clavipes]|nr:hypothetical protein TNCV_2964321 [Trichonephila clavipes]
MNSQDVYWAVFEITPSPRHFLASEYSGRGLVICNYFVKSIPDILYGIQARKSGWLFRILKVLSLKDSKIAKSCWHLRCLSEKRSILCAHPTSRQPRRNTTISTVVNFYDVGRMVPDPWFSPFVEYVENQLYGILNHH